MTKKNKNRSSLVGVKITKEDLEMSRRELKREHKRKNARLGFNNTGENEPGLLPLTNK